MEEACTLESEIRPPCGLIDIHRTFEETCNFQPQSRSHTWNTGLSEAMESARQRRRNRIFNRLRGYPVVADWTLWGWWPLTLQAFGPCCQTVGNGTSKVRPDTQPSTGFNCLPESGRSRAVRTQKAWGLCGIRGLCE
jgi:hypothetical protein